MKTTLRSSSSIGRFTVQTAHASQGSSFSPANSPWKGRGRAADRLRTRRSIPTKTAPIVSRCAIEAAGCTEPMCYCDGRMEEVSPTSRSSGSACPSFPRRRRACNCPRRPYVRFCAALTGEWSWCASSRRRSASRPLSVHRARSSCHRLRARRRSSTGKWWSKRRRRRAVRSAFRWLGTRRCALEASNGLWPRTPTAERRGRRGLVLVQVRA